MDKLKHEHMTKEVASTYFDSLHLGSSSFLSDTLQAVSARDAILPPPPLLIVPGQFYQPIFCDIKCGNKIRRRLPQVLLPPLAEVLEQLRLIVCDGLRAYDHADYAEAVRKFSDARVHFEGRDMGLEKEAIMCLGAWIDLYSGHAVLRASLEGFADATLEDALAHFESCSNAGNEFAGGKVGSLLLAAGLQGIGWVQLIKWDSKAARVSFERSWGIVPDGLANPYAPWALAVIEWLCGNFQSSLNWREKVSSSYSDYHWSIDERRMVAYGDETPRLYGLLASVGQPVEENLYIPKGSEVHMARARQLYNCLRGDLLAQASSWKLAYESYASVIKENPADRLVRAAAWTGMANMAVRKKLGDERLYRNALHAYQSTGFKLGERIIQATLAALYGSAEPKDLTGTVHADIQESRRLTSIGKYEDAAKLLKLHTISSQESTIGLDVRCLVECELGRCFFLQSKEKFWKFWERRSLLHQAEKHLEEAIGLAAHLQASMRALIPFKITVLEPKHPTYRLLGWVLAIQGKNREALVWAERGRARVLVDDMWPKIMVNPPQHWAKSPEQLRLRVGETVTVFLKLKGKAPPTESHWGEAASSGDVNSKWHGEEECWNYTVLVSWRGGLLTFKMLSRDSIFVLTHCSSLGHCESRWWEGARTAEVYTDDEIGQEELVRKVICTVSQAALDIAFRCEREACSKAALLSYRLMQATRSPFAQSLDPAPEMEAVTEPAFLRVAILLPSIVAGSEDSARTVFAALAGGAERLLRRSTWTGYMTKLYRLHAELSKQRKGGNANGDLDVGAGSEEEEVPYQSFILQSEGKWTQAQLALTDGELLARLPDQDFLKLVDFKLSPCSTAIDVTSPNAMVIRCAGTEVTVKFESTMESTMDAPDSILEYWRLALCRVSDAHHDSAFVGLDDVSRKSQVALARDSVLRLQSMWLQLGRLPANARDVVQTKLGVKQGDATLLSPPKQPDGGCRSQSSPKAPAEPPVVAPAFELVESEASTEGNDNCVIEGRAELTGAAAAASQADLSLKSLGFFDFDRMSRQEAWDALARSLRCLGMEGTIVEYSLCDSHGILIQVLDLEQGKLLATCPRRFDSPKAEEQFHELVRHVHEEMSNERPLRESRGDLQRRLEELHKILIRPVCGHLKGHLIIIPDQVLSMVPFNALRADGSYLIQHHTISVAESIRSLILCAKVRTIQQQVFENNNSLRKIGLIVALEDCGVKGASHLKEVRKEAQKVQQVLNDLDYELEVLDDASSPRPTKFDVLEHMPEAQVIHLATHAAVTETYEQGCIICLNTESPAANVAAGEDSMRRFLGAQAVDDAVIQAPEIMSLPLRARVAVLSACYTAGGVRMSEGLLGLGRAFLQGGVPCTVLSQWPVNDRNAAVFMGAFYGFLKEGANIAKAVQRASIQLLTSLEKDKNQRALHDSFAFLPFGLPIVEL